ncbi:protein-cysteine N-palmitoyltransferase Rasp-like [Haemaphysalis longicornis]
MSEVLVQREGNADPAKSTAAMSTGSPEAEESTKNVSPKPETYTQRSIWQIAKIFLWITAVPIAIYPLWKFAIHEEHINLPGEMKRAFAKSPYGLTRKQDISNTGWQITRDFFVATWKWLVLHPLLARLTVHFAPSMVPVFYVAYSTLFVASHISWPSALGFVTQHAVFFAVASLRLPVACYATAVAMILQKYLLPMNMLSPLYALYGKQCYMVTYTTYAWNVLRCLSFSLDFIRAERLRKDENRRRFPPYWRTLAYVLYLPPLYFGPLQNFDDFDAQLNEERPKCTLRELCLGVGGILRNGVRFFMVEGATHYFYISAMSKWPWMAYKLDLPSLVGFGMLLNFFFYMRYLFAYGFAGALARAEGIQLPPPSMCIARLFRCSHLWRYFDRGMHLWSRRYFYEAVVGERRSVAWKLIGTATSFGFAWVWHDMDKAATIWALLTITGIALEVFASEALKREPFKSLALRYLTTPERWRVALAVVGSPHYVLTAFACLFHLASVDLCLVFAKRILLGFPYPLVPILILLVWGCYLAQEWELSPTPKKKQA